MSGNVEASSPRALPIRRITPESLPPSITLTPGPCPGGARTSSKTGAMRSTSSSDMPLAPPTTTIAARSPTSSSRTAPGRSRTVSTRTARASRPPSSSTTNGSSTTTSSISRASVSNHGTTTRPWTDSVLGGPRLCPCSRRPAAAHARHLADQVEPERGAEGERERRHEQAEDLPERRPEAVRRRRVRPSERQPELVHRVDALRGRVGLRLAGARLGALGRARPDDVVRLRDDRSAQRIVLPEPLADRERVGIHYARQTERQREQDQLDAALVPAARAIHRLVERPLDRGPEAVDVVARLGERVTERTANDLVHLRVGRRLGGLGCPHDAVG